MLKYLIMLCYGKYNSFRVKKVGMQDITELFQFAFRRLFHLNKVLLTAS